MQVVKFMFNSFGLKNEDSVGFIIVLKDATINPNRDEPLTNGHRKKSIFHLMF